MAPTSAILNHSSRAEIDTAPFAEGACRWVSRGRYIEGPRDGQRCVAKWFKSGEVFDETFFSLDIQAVNKAQDIIDLFNADGPLANATVYLNHPCVWVHIEGSSKAGQKVLVEPFIENYEKFNSNSGVVIKDTGSWSEAMQALSHFSYHITGGQFVLCDLQGGLLKDGTGVVLTDPVILSRDRQYGITDLGPDGISTFFARHQCNRFCRDGWQQPRDRQVLIKASVGTTMMRLR